MCESAFLFKKHAYQTNVTFKGNSVAEICTMKNKLIRYKLELTGAIIGCIVGYFYWKFVGCASGTCAITSSPVNSSIYGALMGALVLGLFKKQNKKDK